MKYFVSWTEKHSAIINASSLLAAKKNCEDAHVDRAAAAAEVGLQDYDWEYHEDGLCDIITRKCNEKETA